MLRSAFLFLLAIAWATLSAQNATDDLLRRVPADHQNLVVIGDAVPHVRAVLGSETLKTFFASSPLWLDLLGMDEIDLPGLQRQFQLFENLVPRGAVVAAPGSALTAVGEAVNALVTGGLLMAHRRVGTAADGATVRQLSERFDAALGRVVDLRCHVGVRARDERTAAQWFESIGDLLQGLPPDPGLRIEVGADAVTVQARLAELQGGSLPQGLVAFGLPGAAVATAQLDLRLLLDGSTLVLQLGEGAPGRLDPTALTMARPGTPAPFLFAQWDASAMVEAVDQALILLDQEGDSPAGEAFYDMVPEAALLQFTALTTQLSEMLPQGTTALHFQDGMELVQNGDFGVEVDLPVLGRDGILRLVDPTADAFYIAAMELDVLLWVTLDQMETQLMRRAGTELARGASGAQMRALEFLQEDLAGLMQYIGGQDSAVFLPGSVVIMGRGAPLGRLRLIGADGAERSAVNCPVAVPAFAVIGTPVDPGSGVAFVETMVRVIGTGLGLEDVDIREVDLGLGPKTRALPEFVPGPGGARLEIGGELRLHWFTLGNQIVFSTSVALSRELRRRAGQPTADTAGVGVTTWGRITGDQIDAVIGSMVEMTEFLGTRSGAVAFGASEAATRDRTRHTLGLLREFVGLLDVAETNETVDGSRYHARTVLKLGKGKGR